MNILFSILMFIIFNILYVIMSTIGGIWGASALGQDVHDDNIQDKYVDYIFIVSLSTNLLFFMLKG